MKRKIFLIALIVLILPVMSFAVEVETFGYSPPKTITNTASEAGAFAVINSSPNYLQAQPIYPYLLQMIPGVVGDVTDREEMPSFANINPLKKTDKVYKVISYTRGGRIAGFSRLEDFDADLLSLIPTAISKFGQKDAIRIRYKILFKMSVKSIGSGGGGGGSMGGFGGGTNPIAYGTNASIMPAIAVNTSDPKFIIKFYLIK